MKAEKHLDAIMHNVYNGTNPVKMAAWRTARHIKRAPRPATPPTPPTPLIMKPRLINVTTFCFGVSLFGWMALGVCFAQGDKDKQQYEKLERELRKDLDKEISKFKPLKESVAVAQKEPTLNVISRYDKFKDETTVSIAMPLYHRVSPPLTGPVGDLKFIADIDVYVVYSYSGQQPAKPQLIYLLLESTADTTAFGANPSLIFLADNTRIRMGTMIQKVRRYGSLLKETETAEIPIESFVILANADNVEVQVGEVAFPLSELHLRGFRMLAGLPEKQSIMGAQSSRPDLPVDDKRPVENTNWRGSNDLFVEFKLDRTLALRGRGLGDRSGTWVQEGDRVQFELSTVGPGWGGRILAVGITKGNKMAIRMTIRDMLGFGVTNSMVIQQDR